MRFTAFTKHGKASLAVHHEDKLFDLPGIDPDLPDDLYALLLGGDDSLAAVRRSLSALPASAEVNRDEIQFLPPLSAPGKIICIGLNYVDHASESPYKEPPTYPVVFARFASSLVAHDAPLIMPACSRDFDYEGELVAVIGRSGRHIPKADALQYVAGYSIFNEASVRDYQFKSHQWLMGKTFDGTGAFGPDFVTSDELPPGAQGLQLRTRLNGKTVQDANTEDMIFDIPEIIATLSEVMTLNVGDVIVTGTPAGVGFGMKPPVYMKAGDIVEVEITGVGVLRNTVRAEEVKA